MIVYLININSRLIHALVLEHNQQWQFVELDALLKTLLCNVVRFLCILKENYETPHLIYYVMQILTAE